MILFLIFNFSFINRRTKAQVGHLGTSYVTKSLKMLPRLPQSSQIPKNEFQLPKFGVCWMGWSHCGKFLAVREESYPRCLWIWKGLEAKLCDLLVQLDSIVCARWMPQENQTEENDNNSQDAVLAFCCNTPRVYFWTINGSSWADVPPIIATTAASTLPVPPPASGFSKTSSTARSSKNTSTKSSLHRPSAPLIPTTTTTSSSEENIFIDLPISSLKWSADGKQLLLIGKDRFCSCDVSFDFNNDAVLNNFDTGGDNNDHSDNDDVNDNADDNINNA